MNLSAFMMVMPLPSIAGVPLADNAAGLPLAAPSERGETGGWCLEYFGRSILLMLGRDARVGMDATGTQPSTTHIGGTFTVVPITIPPLVSAAIGAGCVQSNLTSI